MNGARTGGEPETGVSTWDAGVETRVRQILDRFPTRKNAAAVGGVSEDMITAYAKGRHTPNIKVVARLCRALGVSLDWVVSGEGPMMLDNQLTARAGPPATQVTVYEGSQLPSDFILLPRYDVRAASGSGAVVHSEQVVDYLAFKVEWVRRTLGIPAENLGLIENVGASNDPTIRHGDLLLVNFGVDRVVADTFYLIGREDELIIKRIQRFNDGDLLLKSDNPAFESERIPAHRVPDLRVLGRVIWVGRMI